ncbi:MAG TPA: ABC transporter permease [bacterium]|jgi:ABC-2 type transport system permease protein|nr:ABC transporter permease [bacterium]
MNWRVLLAFAKKELVQTLRDKRMRTLLLVAPVIQLTLFGLALHNEVRNIRLAVYAAPSDSLAWELGRRAAGTGWFILKTDVNINPFEALSSGQVDAALVAPPGGLDQAVGRGQGRIQLLIDGTNTTRAQGVVQYMDAVRRDVITERVRHGLPDPPSLEMDTRMLYNPTLESKYFMVPGVLAMLLLMVTLTLTSSSITREKEMGTFETLLAAPISPGTILVGKALPYIVLGLLDLPLILCVSYFIFSVPLRGPIWELFVASIAFIGCTVALGILLSTAAQNQQQAMMGSFLTLYPCQMLSGIIYPLDNMPKWLYWITYFNPLRYFAILIRNILLKGGAPELFWPNVGALALLAVILLIVAWKRFSPTLN